MLNTIKLFIKKQLDNNTKSISKTIQSDVNDNILLLFQKEKFKQLDSEYDNSSESEISSESESDKSYESESESDNSSESDFDIINNVYSSISESENDNSEIENVEGNNTDDDMETKYIKSIINNKKKINGSNSERLSFQYDITELLDIVK